MLIKNTLKSFRIYWIAVIIPFIVLFFSFQFKLATGPYWQFPDPSYAYLLSSLSLIKNFSTTYIDHPGTPVQILGAVVILLLNMGQSASGIIHRALLAPDFYLNAINLLMVVFVFITSSILGVYTYRQTNDKLAVLLSQLPLLGLLSLRSFSFYDYVLPVVTNVSPEPLLISISILFNLYFLKLFFAKESQEERLLTICLGFICGLGIATKLTFCPFLLLGLIICKRWMKLLFILVSIMSFTLWTIPIITSYVMIWGWIVRLLTHVGGYGSGAGGFVNIHQYISNWQIILCRCGFLTIFALIGVIFNLVQVARNRSCSRSNVFFLAITFCILVQSALIAKNYDEHYLVCVISLFSPLFVLFYLNMNNKNFIFKSVIFIYVVVFTIQSLGHALTYNKQLSGYTQGAVRFNNEIHAKFPKFIFIGVYPMPFSNFEAAFFEGNDRDSSLQDEIAVLYPDYFSYFSNYVNSCAPYVSGIYSIKQKVLADDLILRGLHILFIAPKGYDFSNTPYTVLPVRQDGGGYAQAYLLVESNEKQANDYFEKSLKLSQEGEYQQAFAFAYKSRELHYQPVEKVDYLLGILYKQIQH
ncbi:MAG: hypothetical protein HQL14_04975 [Candidatus Omnitrophica bacterium]|nr:hypothetical protein [Candidatus Omnitrophota bacterium]